MCRTGGRGVSLPRLHLPEDFHETERLKILCAFGCLEKLAALFHNRIPADVYCIEIDPKKREQEEWAVDRWYEKCPDMKKGDIRLIHGLLSKAGIVPVHDVTDITEQMIQEHVSCCQGTAMYFCGFPCNETSGANVSRVVKELSSSNAFWPGLSICSWLNATNVQLGRPKLEFEFEQPASICSEVRRQVGREIGRAMYGAYAEADVNRLIEQFSHVVDTRVGIRGYNKNPFVAKRSILLTNMTCLPDTTYDLDDRLPCVGECDQDGELIEYDPFTCHRDGSRWIGDKPVVLYGGKNVKSEAWYDDRYNHLREGTPEFEKRRDELRDAHAVVDGPTGKIRRPTVAELCAVYGQPDLSKGEKDGLTQEEAKEWNDGVIKTLRLILPVWHTMGAFEFRRRKYADKPTNPPELPNFEPTVTVEEARALLSRVRRTRLPAASTEEAVEELKAVQSLLKELKAIPETKAKRNLVEKAVFNCGDIYSGEVSIDGQRSGQGTCRYPNGDVYQGEWRDGREEGHGICTYGDGDVFRGRWKDGEMADGEMTYENGDVYKGQWQGGKREGRGEQTFSDGCVYVGDWRSDHMTAGKMKYPTGDIYEGVLVDDKREGHGRCTFADGSVYEGPWLDDEMVVDDQDDDLEVSHVSSAETGYTGEELRRGERVYFWNTDTKEELRPHLTPEALRRAPDRGQKWFADYVGFDKERQQHVVRVEGGLSGWYISLVFKEEKKRGEKKKKTKSPPLANRTPFKKKPALKKKKGGKSQSIIINKK